MEKTLYDLLDTNNLDELRVIAKTLLAEEPHDSLYFCFNDALIAPTVRTYYNIDKCGLRIVIRLCREKGSSLINDWMVGQCEHLLRRYDGCTSKR